MCAGGSKKCCPIRAKRAKNVRERKFLKVKKVWPLANFDKSSPAHLRLRLHKPHVTISRQHALPRSFLKWSPSYIVIAPHCIYPGVMEARVKLVCSEDRTRTSCTHERPCGGSTNALTNWASQTDSIQNYLWVLTTIAFVCDCSCFLCSHSLTCNIKTPGRWLMYALCYAAEDRMAS